MNRISASLLLFASLAAARAAEAQCVPYDPSTAPGVVGAAPVTNPRYYYLSEIGGCANLECWVENVANTSYSLGTLVIDQTCTMNDTLTLPPRFVLAGVGMNMEGALMFPNLSSSQPAIAVGATAGVAATTIRDLTVYGSANRRGYGVALIDASQVSIQNVRIHGFSSGVYGEGSLSVSIDGSNVSDNHYNINLGTICNAWRITNNILNGATRYGIYERFHSVTGAILNTGVYAQNRIESNDLAGIFVSGHGAVVRDNEFELNGTGAVHTAIRVHTTADHTKIVGNMYSGDTIVNNGTNTECGFNALLFSAVQPACP